MSGTPPTDHVREGYDAVAADYAREVGDELERKPLDRALLAMTAERAAGGRIADLGCGPGHVAAFLTDFSADVVGLDLSEGMVAVARERVPRAEFVQGDLRDLPFEDASLVGVVAFYSLIHLVPDDVPVAVREIARVLQPWGEAIIAFHRGDGVRHLDTWWGHDVDIDFRFMDPDVVTGHLVAAGLELSARIDREPIPDAETPTQRTYLVAHRPAG